MNTEEGYDTEMRGDTYGVNERVDSDITVYDSLGNTAGRVRQMVFITPAVIISHEGVCDRGVDHMKEAGKIHSFLKHCISCRTYKKLFDMMLEYDGITSCADMRKEDNDIFGHERTILVLKSVRKMYVDGVCVGCMPESVRTMVDNEIALLRNNVDAMAIDEGDEP